MKTSSAILLTQSHLDPSVVLWLDIWESKFTMIRHNLLAYLDIGGKIILRWILEKWMGWYGLESSASG
jgi:hypothetical protein